jgi:hypothetical protein
MPTVPLILLVLLLPLAFADLLREPDYSVVREDGGWAVRKPGTEGGEPVTISHHSDRSAAELRTRTLPRVRLSRLFVRFDPATSGRTVIADWTGEADAGKIEADLRDVFDRFAPAKKREFLRSTPIYMARLFGASGHTAEESTDFSRFVVYLDPFRATGRLHAAATLIHEFTHLERYSARGFHANRAAAVLPKQDFVLLGLVDELAAYQAEADLVRSFLASLATDEQRSSAQAAINNPELRWPLALTFIAGINGPAGRRRMTGARHQVLLDLAENAGRYWDARHADPLNPELEERIRKWYVRSPEWKRITAERLEWRHARDRGP